MGVVPIPRVAKALVRCCKTQNKNRNCCECVCHSNSKELRDGATVSRGLSRSKEHLESLCLALFIFLGGVCVCVYVPNSKFLTGLEIPLCLPEKLVSRHIPVILALEMEAGGSCSTT